MAFNDPSEIIERDYIIPFGKYKGSRLEELDEDYLIFLRDKFGGLDNFPIIKKYIEEILPSREDNDFRLDD
jgi:hypothetical protein